MDKTFVQCANIISLSQPKLKIDYLLFFNIRFQYFRQFLYLGCLGLSIITVFQLKGLQSKLISHHGYNPL